MRLDKIKLKEKSPEYAEDQGRAAPKAKLCDMEGCVNEASHKAPKNRQLNEHHDFCLQHVTEFNAAWDYFDGLSHAETEQVFVNSIYGDRPTRKMTISDDFIAHLRHKAFEFVEFTTFTQKTERQKQQKQTFDLPEHHPATEALNLFELPITANEADIRAKYRELVKKWHPDKHGGSREAEEKLKHINMAYTLLKVRFERG